MPSHLNKKRNIVAAPSAVLSSASSSDSEDAGVSLSVSAAAGDNESKDENLDGEDDKYDSGSSSSDDGEVGDELSEDGEAETSSSGEPDASDDDDIDDLLAAQGKTGKKRKRNDPATFSTSMSKILSSHLTTAARKDPVLVRAKQAGTQMEEDRLEMKAKRLLREEKRLAMDKGRLRELVPTDDDEAAKNALEKEKMLRKVAQKGVVRLFNAVRAAQVKGEEAARAMQKERVVGVKQREEKSTVAPTFIVYVH